MNSETLSVVTVIVALVLTGLVAVAGLQYFRRLLRVRCARLEDSLRVYNGVNVSIGQHVAVLESEVRELRQRLAALEGAGLRSRLREPVEPVQQEELPGWSVAEMRLEQLIKSRLGQLRSA